MTNPQLLQPQHSQSIRSSALKSNKNVCTADKLGFVLDTSTHTLELSEAFTELLTEAAKHPIRTQNDLLEAAASELDRNLLDHALTAHDSPFEYVRFKTGNQVSWTRIALQTRITFWTDASLAAETLFAFIRTPRIFCRDQSRNASEECEARGLYRRTTA